MLKTLIKISRVIVALECFFHIATASAAITIDPIARTFTKTGGANSINTSGEGTWVASTDVDWIAIKPRTSGAAGVSCVYVVSANKTADTRVGHVMIDSNVHTVTQTGYDAILVPEGADLDLNPHEETISVEVDAGVSWSAVANEEWISIYPDSGVGSGSITYEVRSYDGLVPRNGSITIAGKTFEIVQHGQEVMLRPEAVSVSYEAGIVEIGVLALSSTAWSISPGASWVGVVDSGNGFGDANVILSVEENPSYYPRVAEVQIGTAVLRLTQRGNEDVSIKITPEEVRADASGAYGNILISPKPYDAPWSVESFAEWATLAEGSSGNGTDIVHYVVSPNTTYEDRSGVIKIKPILQRAEPDYYSGLVLKTRPYSVLGHEPEECRVSACYYDMSSRIDGDYYYIPTKYNSRSYALTESQGRSLTPKTGNDFSFLLDFSMGELKRVNRLFMLNGHCVFIDESNHLNYDGQQMNLLVEETNTFYTVLVSQDIDGVVKIYAGKKGARLTRLLMEKQNFIFDFSHPVRWDSIVLGYANLPSVGYLIGGQLKGLSFWTRCLTEIESLGVSESDWELHDFSPKYLPQSLTGDDWCKWFYCPLDENFFAGQTGGDLYMGGRLYDGRDVGYAESDASSSDFRGGCNRFGISHKCLESTNKAWRVNYRCDRDNVRNTAHSFSLWMYVAEFSEKGDEILLAQRISKNNLNQSPSSRETAMVIMNRNGFKVRYGKGGIEYARNGTEVSFPCQLTTNEWIMLSGTEKYLTDSTSGNGDTRKWSLTLYVNGLEIGNTTNWLEGEQCYERMGFGAWLGRIDDLFVESGSVAITSDDVYKLYQETRFQEVPHVITQGYIVPALSETNVVVDVAGETKTVGLSIGSRVSWSARENVNWLHITSAKQGTGPTIITYDVDANPRVDARVGTITIADVVLTVRQPGLWSEVEADTTMTEVDGGYGFVTVTTEADALWSAVSDANWLTIVDGEEGQGVGTVMWVADPYTDSTHSRIGSMTIASKKVYITQRGYELSVAASGTEVSSMSEEGQVDVSAPPGAEWPVLVTVPWIKVTSGDFGVGNGSVRYVVEKNTTGAARSGVIIIAGEEYTITQTSTVEVKVQTRGAGTVSGSGAYEQYATIDLIATPNSGYVFSHWDGDVSGSTNHISVVVDDTKNVTATFIPESAAEKIAHDRQGGEGLYTRDQIHALELGNLLFDVDSKSNTARIGVRLMTTEDLSVPNWQPVPLTKDNIDIGLDASLNVNVPANGNARFFKVVVPEQNKQH